MDDSSFSGSVFEFGIKNCLRTEVANLWSRRRRVRVDNISDDEEAPADKRIDITRKQITRLWTFGLFGTLGLQFFPIGRFITGTLRLLYGVLLWVICIVIVFMPQAAEDVNNFHILLVFLVCLLIPSLIDVINILTGNLCDVFGSKVE